MKIPVFDLNAKKQSPWSVDHELLGKPSEALLAQAIRVYLSNSHQKTSKVKTRGEVVGSTRKIYRQKGTGNARHGAKYAPIFVGGGIAHGPTGVRPTNLVLPKAMRRRSLAAALSVKLTAESVIGIANISRFKGKTSALAELLSSVTKHPAQSVLIVTDNKIDSLYQGAQNLQGVSLKRVSLVNALDLVSSDHLILTKKSLASLINRIQLAK